MTKHLIYPPIPERTVSSQIEHESETRTPDEQLRHALLLFAGPAGINILPEAQAAVKAIAAGAAEALDRSEVGQALTTLQRRHEAAAEKLAQATESNSAAERAHFESLANGTDAEVEQRRAAAMEAAASLSVLKREQDILEELLTSTRAKLKAAKSEFLEQARLNAIAENSEKHKAALATLVKLVRQPEMQRALRDLALTGTVSSVCGGSTRHFERNIPMFVHEGHFVP